MELTTFDDMAGLFDSFTDQVAVVEFCALQQEFEAVGAVVRLYREEHSSLTGPDARLYQDACTLRVVVAADGHEWIRFGDFLFSNNTYSRPDDDEQDDDALRRLNARLSRLLGQLTP